MAPPRLATVARAIAVAFLLPLGWGIAGIRHALLLLFCATTNALAPVAGFGWPLFSELLDFIR